MYGLVAMVVLSASSETPDFHKYKSGACYGCYGYGCYSATVGGHHGWNNACYGNWACSGGACYGGACYGYGGCIGVQNTWSCWGCYGCWGSTQTVPEMPPADKTGSKDKERSSIAPDRARLVVEVPADAKLYIDDQLMKTTSEKRIFNTPPIEQGSTYYYILRVEIEREGNTLTEHRRVLIRGGEETRYGFTESSIAAATPSGTKAAARK